MIKDERTGEPRPKLVKRKELGSNEFLCENESVWIFMEGKWFLDYWLIMAEPLSNTGPIIINKTI